MEVHSSRLEQVEEEAQGSRIKQILKKKYMSSQPKT
jgi:hypothetical protein